MNLIPTVICKFCFTQNYTRVPYQMRSNSQFCRTKLQLQLYIKERLCALMKYNKMHLLGPILLLYRPILYTQSYIAFYWMSTLMLTLPSSCPVEPSYGLRVFQPNRSLEPYYYGQLTQPSYFFGQNSVLLAKVDRGRNRINSTDNQFLRGHLNLRRSHLNLPERQNQQYFNDVTHWILMYGIKLPLPICQLNSNTNILHCTFLTLPQILINIIYNA